MIRFVFTVAVSFHETSHSLMKERMSFNKTIYVLSRLTRGGIRIDKSCTKKQRTHNNSNPSNRYVLRYVLIHPSCGITEASESTVGAPCSRNTKAAW